MGAITRRVAPFLFISLLIGLLVLVSNSPAQIGGGGGQPSVGSLPLAPTVNTITGSGGGSIDLTTDATIPMLNSTGAGLTVNVASTLLEDVSGASVTATNLVPARAQVIGVGTYVVVALGTGNGTTGYTVGDGSDVDRFGAVTGTAIGTDTDSTTDATADPRYTWSASAQDVVVTAAGGNFDATGDIRVAVTYLGDTAPTQ